MSFSISSVYFILFYFFNFTHRGFQGSCYGGCWILCGNLAPPQELLPPGLTRFIFEWFPSSWVSKWPPSSQLQDGVQKILIQSQVCEIIGEITRSLSNESLQQSQSWRRFDIRPIRFKLGIKLIAIMSSTRWCVWNSCQTKWWRDNRNGNVGGDPPNPSADWNRPAEPVIELSDAFKHIYLLDAIDYLWARFKRKRNKWKATAALTGSRTGHRSYFLGGEMLTLLWLDRLKSGV